MELARFLNIKLRYRPSKKNVRADALSRRDQNMQKNDLDEHLASREFTILVPAQAQKNIAIMPVRDTTTTQRNTSPLVSTTLPQPPHFPTLVRDYWDNAAQADSLY